MARAVDGTCDTIVCPAEGVPVEAFASFEDRGARPVIVSRRVYQCTTETGTEKGLPLGRWISCWTGEFVPCGTEARTKHPQWARQRVKEMPASVRLVVQFVRHSRS